jgi:hypothetical protein
MKRDEMTDKLTNALFDYVIRICSADNNPTPSQVEALPEVVNALIRLIS